MNIRSADKRPYRMTARREAVEQTRERIMESAYALLVERPYDEVTVDDVADAAGVSRQTVHRQFGSKDDLLVAVIDWRRPAEDERSRQSDPGDVAAAVRMQIERYEEVGDAMVRFLELEGRIDAVDRLLATGRQGHVQEIEHGFAPWLDPLDPEEREQVVLALYAATDIMIWKLLRRDFGRSRDEVEATMRMLVDGVLQGLPGPSTEDGP